MSVDNSVETEQPPVAPGEIAATRWRRLVLGETAVDFWGRRWWWFGLSLAMIVISVVSLSVNGLNLGLDFTGGVAWDVPAENFSVDEAEGILGDNGIDATSAKIQERSSDSGAIIKVQVDDQPEEVRTRLQQAFAEGADVTVNDISVSSVSSQWGWSITKKAIWALAIFLGLIAIFISIRFEWRMAVASLLAMVHDVVISVGIYSVFGFVVTPATVIAFLTVLGYSLYDTIVVFDRVKENERRLTAGGLSAADLVNVSVNQVLLRSLNTTIAAVLPVVSLLLVGAGVFGQVTLQEFAIALFVGLAIGAYSSLFVATPLLGWLKSKEPQFARRHGTVDTHLVGDDLRAVVVRGTASMRPPAGRRRPAACRRADARQDGGAGGDGARRVEHAGPQPPAPPP